MSHVPHELAEEFPDHKDRIHDLKMNNAHFARLADEYHTLNREIHRIEAAGINVDDPTYEDLKKQRLALKDEVFAMLNGG
ncbi:MAG: hypothetical protein APF80_10565 [Alphaproteobacteria bacterium BRH_c36]|nr:MAG: hypothetical protein APF80_10565 [Alphaproteobacteria bacterium BRH_c36]